MTKVWMRPIGTIRSAAAAPPLDPATFVAAGERVAAASPGAERVVRARARIQAALTASQRLEFAW